VIFIILVIVYLSFVSSKTVSARLLVEKGQVFVNDQEVSGDVLLDEKDKITTFETGKATIVLYESIVVVLEPETTITVTELSKKHPKLSQEKGETWSQFTKLFGVEDYSIKTSTSVASVRGTGFSLTDSIIFVGEGEVIYEVYNLSYAVEGGKAVETFGEMAKERDMTPEEKERARIKKLEVINSFKKLRILEIAKHQKTLDFLKNKYGFDDEDISNYLNQADRGEVNLEDLREKAPLEIGSLEKLIAITDKIKELNSVSSR